MDFRAFRFQEYDGQRLSVRIAQRERQKLRALATATECSESELVREAVQVYVNVMTEELAVGQE